MPIYIVYTENFLHSDCDFGGSCEVFALRGGLHRREVELKYTRFEEHGFF